MTNNFVNNDDDLPTIGLEDFKAIRDAISRIGVEVRSTRSEFDIHLKTNDLIMESVNKNIEHILKEIHAQSEKFSRSNIEQRDHTEEKIKSCYAEMTNNFVTKDQLIITRDEAVSESKDKRRIEMKNSIDDLRSELIKMASSHLRIVWGSLIIIAFICSFILDSYYTGYKSLQSKVTDNEKEYNKHLIVELKHKEK